MTANQVTNGFEEFTIEDARLGITRLDIEKVLNLSDEEFARRYNQTMNQYFEGRKRQEGREQIHCLECTGPIRSPGNLTRLEGGNYHRSCFAEHWHTKERTTRESPIREYGDRLAKLQATQIETNG